MEHVAEDLAQWATSHQGKRLFFHGTGVAFEGRGVLILGPSGSGKSTLALGLLAHGATLISDDGIWLDAGQLVRPDIAPPFIEARGVGLLNAGPSCPQARLALVVDLSRPEPMRLPPQRQARLPDQKVQLILGAGQTTLPATLLHLLRFGRAEV